MVAEVGMSYNIPCSSFLNTLINLFGHFLIFKKWLIFSIELIKESIDPACRDQKNDHMVVDNTQGSRIGLCPLEGC